MEYACASSSQGMDIGQERCTPEKIQRRSRSRTLIANLPQGLWSIKNLSQSPVGARIKISSLQPIRNSMKKVERSVNQSANRRQSGKYALYGALVGCSLLVTAVWLNLVSPSLPVSGTDIFQIHLY